MDTFNNTEKEFDVMRSAFGIARALKRSPHRAPHILPPGMERTLMTVAANDGISSGELCEILDVRPSSLSEITDKLAERGLMEKKDSETDKRITLICLTELGKAQAEQIAKTRNDAIAELSACFTEDEAKMFCELADKLSEHLKGLSGGDEHPEGFGPHGPHGHHGPHGPFGGHGPHGPHCMHPGHGFGPQPGPFGPGHCGHRIHHRPIFR